MISYKESQCIPVEYILNKCPVEYYPRALSCSVYLESSDGYIVFGLKKNNHRIIGGVYSPEELVLHGGNDIFKMAKIEVEQEVGVPKEYIQDLELVGGVQTSKLNISLVFKGRIPFSKIEITNFFNRDHDPELDSLTFIHKHTLSSYVEEFHPEKKIILPYLASL